MQEVSPVLPLGLLGSAFLLLAAPGPLKALALMSLLGVG
jgi:hypothetical protein